MKTKLILAAFFSLLAAMVQADNILVYKVVGSSSRTYYNEDNPGLATAKGTTLAFTYTSTSYLVINVSAPGSGGGLPGQYIEVTTDTFPTLGPAVDKNNVATTSKKVMYFPNPTMPNDLSGLLAPHQPLKLKDNYLWNTSGGFFGGNDSDSDTNGTADYFSRYFSASSGRGTGKPFVVSTTLTIPNVVTTFVLKSVNTYTDSDLLGFPGSYPPYDDFGKGLDTETWTLDVTLTKLSNTTPIPGSADIPLTGSQAAGSLTNGVQRVHDLLYSQGYRIGAGGGSGSGP